MEIKYTSLPQTSYYNQSSPCVGSIIIKTIIKIELNNKNCLEEENNYRVLFGKEETN